MGSRAASAASCRPSAVERQCFAIERERRGGAAVGVARHLVEQNDQCQPALGAGRPTRELAAQCALEQGFEPGADIRVAGCRGSHSVAAEPERGAFLEPRRRPGRQCPDRLSEFVASAVHWRQGCQTQPPSNDVVTLTAGPGVEGIT